MLLGVVGLEGDRQAAELARQGLGPAIVDQRGVQHGPGRRHLRPRLGHQGRDNEQKGQGEGAAGFREGH